MPLLKVNTNELYIVSTCTNDTITIHSVTHVLLFFFCRRCKSVPKNTFLGNLNCVASISMSLSFLSFYQLHYQLSKSTEWPEHLLAWLTCWVRTTSHDSTAQYMSDIQLMWSSLRHRYHVPLDIQVINERCLVNLKKSVCLCVKSNQRNYHASVFENRKWYSQIFRPKSVHAKVALQWWSV